MKIIMNGCLLQCLQAMNQHIFLVFLLAPTEFLLPTGDQKILNISYAFSRQVVQTPWLQAEMMKIRKSLYLPIGISRRLALRFTVNMGLMIFQAMKELILFTQEFIQLESSKAYHFSGT